ncbi:hypothetical protein [Salinispora vitiensis]|nr:hypothetical protein [Salinispora vitiensis]
MQSVSADLLSAAQRHPWFLHRADSADTGFPVPIAVRIRGG